MTTSQKTFSHPSIVSMQFFKTRFRIGLTLIEIMIALVMTLIVLGAMMTAFQFASREMQSGRAALEMANRLRVTEEVLRSDLRNLMVDPRPYTDSTNPNGYFEYIEGPKRDSTLSFTAMDTDAPFPNSDGILDTHAVDLDGDGYVTYQDRFLPDSDSDNIANPHDVTSTAGADLDGNGIDDDFDPLAVGNSFMGDHDDIWSGTIRSDKRPFRGRYVVPNDSTTYPAPITTITQGGGFAYPPTITPIESPLAEVVWWTEYADTTPNFKVDFNGESVVLYRRLLLIVPPSVPLPAFPSLEGALEYLAVCDISAHIDSRASTGLFHIVANSAKGLAHRSVRFGHHSVTAPGRINSNADTIPTALPDSFFPHELRRSTMGALRSADYVLTGGIDDIDNVPANNNGRLIAYNGNDIMLTDVTAFDIKVYSPTATVAVQPTANLVVEPNDVGFLNLPVANRAVLGAYVDLGHPGGGWFSGMPAIKSQLAYQYRLGLAPTNVRMVGQTELVYDTWTPVYESDGVNQDWWFENFHDMTGYNTTRWPQLAYEDTTLTSPVWPLVDEGSDGQDQNTSGPAAPDDSTEQETSPPYPYPVRGIKITTRLIEKNTKQVHQSSVVHSYVPE